MSLPKGPYDSIPEELRSKVQAMVPTEDKHFLQSICPVRGILLYLTESFLFAIINDLKSHGITHYSPENAERLYSFIRDRTSPELTHSGREQAKPRTASRVCQPTPDPEILTSDLHESPKRGVGRGGSKNGDKEVKRKSSKGSSKG